jgi:hypothetical protein
MAYIFGEGHKQQSSSLCIVTSSLLCPNILLSTLFSNTLSLCYSLKKRSKFYTCTKQKVELYFNLYIVTDSYDIWDIITTRLQRVEEFYITERNKSKLHSQRSYYSDKLVHMVMKPLNPYEAGNFLTTWATISFPRALLHWISLLEFYEVNKTKYKMTVFWDEILCYIPEESTFVLLLW